MLAIQLVATLLYPADQRNQAAERQQIVDRPMDPSPAANPSRKPSGRGLIQHVQWTAKAS